jgi:hypothetical protein
MERVLLEDGYRVLRSGELPLPDDLVVYRDRLLDGQSEILHVGRIFWVDQNRVGAVAMPVVWVISKWNSTSGEWLHRAFDVPYGKLGFNLEIEYITDRPLQGDPA